MKKVFIKTQGCSNNASESEVMAGILEKGSYKIVKTAEEADLIIINSCTVKGDNTALKAIKDAKKEFPKKKIVVAGCLTKSLLDEIDKIDEKLCKLNTHNLNKVKKVVDSAFQGIIYEELEDNNLCKIEMPRKRSNPIIGIIPISEGCNQYCAYCSVILVKGMLKSYPNEKIVKEVERCVKEGCKEIWITSQDNGSYGTDGNPESKSRLPELLRELLKIEGDFKVRVGMMNPHFLKPVMKEMIDLYKDDKMFKFLHIPLQSGSDEVLKRMRRRYAVEDFVQIVEGFRKEIPEITISTDIIIGFPGETEKDFEKSYDLLKKVKPDVLNISRFVPRPGTLAATLNPHVSSNAIKERSQKITTFFQEISLANNKKWIGWKGEILIDEEGKKGTGTMIGRNNSYKPIILFEKHKIGDRIKVKILDATKNYLRAQPIK